MISTRQPPGPPARSPSWPPPRTAGRTSARATCTRCSSSDPQLAVDAGSAALQRSVQLPGITPAVLEAIEALLPEHRHVDLDVGIAALATRLATHRLSMTDDRAKRARIHHDLGVDLS